MRKYKIGDRIRRLQEHISRGSLKPDRWNGVIIGYQESETNYRIRLDCGVDIVWDEKNFERWNKLKETLK